MAKRLNKKVVVGLTIAGMIVTTIAGVAMVAFLPGGDPKVFVRQAEQFAAKADYEQARDYYQRAWQRARSAGGDSAESNGYLLLMGDMALKAGDAAKAFTAWKNVLLNDRNNEQAQQKIVEFNLDYAKLWAAPWSDVQKEAQELLRINKANPVALHALGRSLIAQRAVDPDLGRQGEERLAEAIKADPRKPEYADSLGQFYFQEAVSKFQKGGDSEAVEAVKEQIKKAVEVYNAPLDSPSDDPKVTAVAYRQRGLFYLGVKDLEQALLERLRQQRAYPDEIEARVKAIAEADVRAAKDLEEAVRLAPQDVEALVGIGNYWQFKRAVDANPETEKVESEKQRPEWLGQARQCYEEAVKADPDHFVGYMQLAWLYLREREYGKALKVLDERIGRGYKREHYLGWRGREYMAWLRYQAFKTNWAKLLDLGLLVSDTQEREKQRAELTARMEDLVKKSSAEAQGGEEDPRVLTMKGLLLAAKEDYFEAVNTLEQADKLAPALQYAALEMATRKMVWDATWIIKRTLAQLYLDPRVNAPGLAKQKLREIIEGINPDDSGAWSMLASALVRTGEYKDAIRIAEQALQLDPNNREAMGARFEAARQTGDLAVSEAGVEPGSVGSKLQRAVLLVSQVQASDTPNPQIAEEAERLFREVLQADPLNDFALRSIAALLGRDDESTRRNAAKIAEILDAAQAAVEKRKAEPAVATQPADDRAIKGLEFLIKSIRILADVQASRDDKFKRLEALVKEWDDPYAGEIQLYHLCQMYSTQPGAQAQEEAGQHLKKAYDLAISRPDLKPNEPWVANQLFDFALRQKDWPLAEQMLDKCIAMGLDPSGGCFYRGRLHLARAEYQRPASAQPAIDEFLAGTKAAPAYPAGWFWLGDAYRIAQQYDKANEAFREAYSRNPRHTAAALGLAVMADLLDNPADKKKYLEVCRKLIPQHAWVKEQLLLEQDEISPEKGILRREEMRNKEPQDVTNLFRLADLYVRVKQFDKARELYEKCLELEPANLKVAHNYAVFLRGLEPPRFTEAAQVLQRAVQAVAPDNVVDKTKAQLALAHHMWMALERGGPDAPSRSDVDAAHLAVEKLSPTPGVLIDIGNYFWRTRRFDEGKEWLRKAVQMAQDRANREAERLARHTIVQMMINTRDAQQDPAIQTELDAFRARFPGDPVTQLLRAEWYAALAHDDEAIEAFTEYINKTPNPAVGYYRRGFVYLRASQWSQAVRDLQEAKRLDPQLNNYEPRILLALALESSGQPEQAVAELQSILEEDRGIENAVKALFSMYLKLRRPDSAESLVATRVKAEPENPVWHSLLSQVARFRDKPDQALQAARDAALKSNLDPQMLFDLVGVHLQFRRYDDLIAFFTGNIPAERRGTMVFMALGSAYAGKRDAARTIEHYVQAFNAPDFTVTPFMLALREDFDRRLDIAETQKALEQRLESHPHERGSKLILALINRQVRKDLQSSQKILQELLDTAEGADPRMVREKGHLLRELASIEYDRGNFEESRKFYERALEIYEQDVFSLNNLAYLLMDRLGQPEAALPYAQKAAQILESPGILDTLGWCLTLVGQHDQGLTKLVQAMEGLPENATVHYHAAEAYYRRSQVAGNPKAAADLQDAKTEFQRSYQLFVGQLRDVENIHDGFVALGQKLGVPFDQARLPTTNVTP